MSAKAHPAVQASARKIVAESLESRVLFTNFAVLLGRIDATPGIDPIAVQLGGNNGKIIPKATLFGRRQMGVDVPDQTISIGNAVDVHLADINGDGFDDVIYSRDAGTALTRGKRQHFALLNDGNGNFDPLQAIPLVPTDRNAGAIVATGDLNGDGVDDLLLANAGNDGVYHIVYGSKSIGRGGANANGSISPDITLRKSISVIFLADDTGDGKADIIFAASGPKAAVSDFGISSLNSNGQYVISSEVFPTNISQIVVGSFADPKTIQIGAISPGGQAPDSTVSPPLLTPYQLDAKGNLTPTAPIALPSDYPTTNLNTGDLDGDGLTDLFGVAADGSQARMLHLTISTGVVKFTEFDSPIENANLQATASVIGGGCVPCDLDGDGFQEIVAAGSNPFDPSGGMVFEGTNPLFEPKANSGLRPIWRTNLPDDAVLPNDVPITGKFLKGNRGTSVDMTPTEFAAMINSGDLTTGPTMLEIFGEKPGAPPELRNAFVLPHVLEKFVADINGDGIDDIILVSRDTGTGVSTGRLDFTVLTSDGAGNFSVGKTWAGPACDAVDAVADVNGDGKADLIVRNNGLLLNSYTTLFSNGDGSFTSSTPRLLPAVQKLVEAMDINGDGKADFMYEIVTPRDAQSGMASGLVVINGTGNGDVLGNLFTVQAVAIPNITDVVAGDFNGDGIADLCVVTSPDGTNALKTGRRQYQPIIIGKNGIIAPQQAHDLPSGMPTGIVIAGDFNGDGVTDLAFASPTSIAAMFSVKDATGVIFVPGFGINEQGVHFTSFAAGDINGDGIDDLLVTSTGSLRTYFGSSKTATIPTFQRGYTTPT